MDIEHSQSRTKFENKYKKTKIDKTSKSIQFKSIINDFVRNYGNIDMMSSENCRENLHAILKRTLQNRKLICNTVTTFIMLYGYGLNQ